MAAINGSLTNGSNHDTHPLTIVIVGAGIGGLTAAVALRQQGHYVHLYEQSRFSKELGAAIHLAPNANGVLKRMGISALEDGATPCEQITQYTSKGVTKTQMNLKQASRIWQHEWLFAHRVSLHDRLKKTATDASGTGPPAQLHLSMMVADIDPENGAIYLEDGTKVNGDVILGADGLHSICRSKVSDGKFKPFPSGKSAFRFLISRKSAQDDPITKKYADVPGELSMWYAADRRLVMYPTSDNTMLNFVCIHPDTESDGTGDWSTEANKTMLLETYKDFEEGCRGLLSKADAATLKVWKLMDMDVLPTWVEGRLALLGDAAHPFLPHQGQGGATAIEDAIALGVVLERGLRREDVPVRLKLYEEIRRERAHRIQEYTRIAGKDVHEQHGVSINMLEYTNYNFGHDEFDRSTQRLREWKWSQVPQVYWRMPVAFGPMPGPRQTHDGAVQNGTQSTFTTASIKIKTSRTVLQNLFPPGKTGWRFKSPGTVAYCSFSQTTLNKMEWLGGSGYNHLGLYIHGVEYVKDNGEVANGTYLPMLFENLTDPIVSGREELGMPKLYSSIDIERTEDSYRIKTGWQGVTWGEFTWEGLASESLSEEAKGSMTGDDNDEGILVQRYIPKVGREEKGNPEADYTVFDVFKDETPKARPAKVLTTKDAKFSIMPGDWSSLPTLHHIIQRLQEIPVYEIVDAKVVEGLGVHDVAAARRIS